MIILLQLLIKIIIEENMLDSLPQFLEVAKEQNVTIDLKTRLVDDDLE